MGQERDFDAFCVREVPRLVGALSVYTGDRFIAHELAQEALVRAFERWEQVSSMAAPGAWVHRVAMNLANSHFRRLRVERRAIDRRRQRARDGDHPVDEQGQATDAVLVREAVSHLPRRQREIITLRFFYDLSSAQAADLLDISEGYARVLTHRAIQSLRERLDLKPEVDDVR